MQGGGLENKGLLADAPLPPLLPAGSYAMTSSIYQAGENVFYLAVSLIVLGFGFLKPNISTLVGQICPQGDTRRDAGFTL